MPKIVMNPLQTAKSAKSYKSIPLNLSQPFALCTSSRGQTLVEFSLIFVLFLVIVWIPVDFGLAFYSSQLAQNAAREGARIASADPTLTAINSTCAMPACYSFGNLFNETATRVPPALLTGTTITIT